MERSHHQEAARIKRELPPTQEQSTAGGVRVAEDAGPVTVDNLRLLRRRKTLAWLALLLD
ncbi:hypothetical protein MUK42_34240 [Musa troglodytarum]|uniref:Uncharacterized protein n=1 Tax=Musa troglodytarum TaxID=320322 RepID=A0A9E7GKC9_9LILI|nr:hypothetical protein MUK42_34240 [Musa troglodytarum]